MQPGQSFENFKAEKMKKFDKDKDQKFSKQEVKNILDKTYWRIFSNRLFTESDLNIFYEINQEFPAGTYELFFQVSFYIAPLVFVSPF